MKWTGSFDLLVANVVRRMKQLGYLGDVATVTGLDVATGDARYVNVTGDTMTGDLIVSKAAPSLQLAGTTDADTDIPFSTGAALRWRFVARSSADGNDFVLHHRSGGAWVNAWRIQGSTGGMVIYGPVQASPDNAWDIGGAANRFVNGYFSNTVFMGISSPFQAAQRRQDLGNRTGAVTVGFGTGASVRMVLTGNVVLTYTGTTVNTGVTYQFEIVQDATGGRTITFPGPPKWEGGVAYVPSAAPNARDMVWLYYNGTDYSGWFRKGFA